VKSRGEREEDVAIVSLEVAAAVGDVFVSLLLDEREARHYRFWGGEAERTLLCVPEAMQREVTVRELARARYYENGEDFRAVLDATGEKGREGMVIGGRISSDSLALASGCYVFQCEAAGLTDEPGELEIVVEDARGMAPLPVVRAQIPVKRGLRELRVPFSKPFAPYECRIGLACRKGRCRLVSWCLRPDVSAILTDWAQWGDTDRAPGWAGGKREPRPSPFSADAVRFGRHLTLRSFALERVVKPDQVLMSRCALSLDRFPMPKFGEYHVFVHLLDGEGRQVFAGGFPVGSAVEALGSGHTIFCGRLPDLPPGRYEAYLGVWNGRTRHVLPVQGVGLTRKERRKRRVRVATVTVIEPEA
jgi:hypothetical protein